MRTDKAYRSHPEEGVLAVSLELPPTPLSRYAGSTVTERITIDRPCCSAAAQPMRRSSQSANWRDRLSCKKWR